MELVASVRLVLCSEVEGIDDLLFRPLPEDRFVSGIDVEAARTLRAGARGDVFSERPWGDRSSFLVSLPFRDDFHLE